MTREVRLSDSWDGAGRERDIRQGIDLATTLERIEKNFVITDPRLPDNPIVSDKFMTIVTFLLISPSQRPMHWLPPFKFIEFRNMPPSLLIYKTSLSHQRAGCKSFLHFNLPNILISTSRLVFF